MSNEKSENIYIVKLVTGEQFVSEVENDFDGDAIKLNHPLNIIPMQDPSTRNVAITLQPVLMFTEEQSVVVDPSHIIWMVKAEEKMIDGWNDTVNPSEIITPQNKELILPR